MLSVIPYGKRTIEDEARRGREGCANVLGVIPWGNRAKVGEERRVFGGCAYFGCHFFTRRSENKLGRGQLGESQ